MTSVAQGAIPEWTVGDRLRKAREHAGLTQLEMAQAIDVSVRTVVNYESRGTVKRPVLLAWALRCQVDLAWLESGSIDPTPGGDWWAPRGSNPQPTDYKSAVRPAARVVALAGRRRAERQIVPAAASKAA